MMKTYISLLNMRKQGIHMRLAGFLAMLALVLGFTQVARADSGFIRNFVIVNPSGAGNTYYKTGGFDAVNDATNAAFDGKDFGSFSRGGSLILNGGQAQTYKNSANNVTSNITQVQMYYRLYRTGTTAPTFTQLILNFNQDNGYARNSTDFDQTWQTNNAGINLLSLIPASSALGAYTVEVYTQATDQGNGTTPTDNNGGSNYKATFTLAQQFTPTGQTTNWISNRDANGTVQSSGSTAGVNDDWLNSNNWSNGVPNAFSDAYIPDHASGTTPTYRPSLNAVGGNYRVRNLALGGTGVSDRGVLRITTATLRLYGDFTNVGGGLLATTQGNNTSNAADSTQNSTLVLAGPGVQYVRGETTVTDIRVAGAGIKGVVNAMLPQNSISFAPLTSAGVILRTAFDDTSYPHTTDPAYNDNKTGNIALSDIAVILGETNVSYIDGVTLAEGIPQANTTSRFGNIGFDYRPNTNFTANMKVTRVTGGAGLTGPTGASPPIKRFFGISSSYPAGVTGDITFHYLPHEIGSIVESNLDIFKTTNGGIPYSELFGTVDTNLKTVTKTAFAGVINTITLGDKTNPLPVTLTAFDAVRTGENALITWATASETNNKGFAVEVSTDGAVFHALSFVASKSSTSLTKQNYSYLDTEAGKTGNRYYRLHQIDLDGKSAYSGIKVVSFDGIAASSGKLVAYPNPFTNSLSLTIDGGSAVHVRLVDVTGRLVLEQNIAGDSSPSISGLDTLNAGIYLAKVTMTDGSTQTVRIQKQ
ncbi:MAG: T9SS type A sorting domain-containing protein [Janthinobacterium lividum]